ncbi:MAG TPA: Bax inhibitor-1/YccA family protein, partial [Planctomycetaceae bacterium]|nr:Bax inhibitor-1/YccA family protein [Planctomycetaceae bacterium]
LNESVFLDAARDYGESRTMTLEGTVLKTGMLLCVLMAAAGFTWAKTQAALPALTAETAGQAARMAVPANAFPYMLVGMIGGFVVSLITVFKPSVSPFTAPLYAALEGLALGGISTIFEYQFPGIVLNAVALTFGTLAVLLAAYSTGLIRPTENFKLGLIAATGGIALVYLASFVLGLFGVAIPMIHESGMVGIGFSLFVVVIAALNLVLDFDFIETGVQRGAPKYMEWYGGFGLLVTLVWLYLEILRLLSKLRSRD